MKREYCDICGKEIFPFVSINFLVAGIAHTNKTERYKIHHDICNECVDEVKQAIQKMKDGK